ncbi:MAG: zinc-ribbon domain-containing protein [Boseongicola sp.]
MRLICPNCSAQYEIDENLIPDEGRDVQCSNCGNNWFELPPPMAEGLEPDIPVEEHAEVIERPLESDYSPPSEAMHEPEQEQEQEAVAELDADPAQDESTTREQDDGWDWPETRLVSPVEVPSIPETPAAAPEPTRRPADVADLDVLRQEAEHEISKRRSEAATIESQAEFGLAAPEQKRTPSRALRARMARLRGEDEDEGGGEPETVEEDYQAPRRDLLPDIEEINSTLRPTSARGAEPVSPVVVAERQRGFRFGFVASVGICALLVIVYAWAPAIASAVPGTEQALIAYVDWANAARDALDGLIANVSDSS